MITATLHHLRIPFARAFGHALATRDAAEALVLVIAAPGEATPARVLGVGECVPRPYVTGETFDSAWRAITASSPSALWARLDRSSPAALAASALALELPAQLRSRASDDAPAPLALAAACAVELALLDLSCRLAGWRLSDLAFALKLPETLVGPERSPLPEVISIPLDFTRQPADLTPLVGSRLGHLKIKVGADLAEDVRRVRECRQRFGPSLSMSVDANMAWSFDDALRAADALLPFDLAWYEEPLRAEDRLRYPELRLRAAIAVMLDEAACSYAQADAAIAAGACDLLNLRLSKCGGYLATLRLAARAHADGVRFQHGAQVGQLGFLNAAGRHFTSVVRGVVACEGGPGLANLTDFPTTARLALDWDAGHLVGLEGPGLGASPDLDKLARYSIRAARWDGGSWC